MERGEGNGDLIVLKDGENFPLIRLGASQWNPDKSASTCIHAFVMVGESLAETLTS